MNLIFELLGSAAFVGAFGWLFQLGNRVSVLEVQQPDLKELINAQFDDVSRRLDRIERSMNGFLRGVS